jgi:type I restriction enzyme S subunit
MIWPKVRIDSVGEVQAGRQRSANIVTGMPRPYLRVANVFDGYIDYQDVLRMPFTDREFSIYSLKPGDILLNEGQSLELVGRSAIYDGPPNKHCFQNTLVRFRPSENIDPLYAQIVFQHMLATGVFSSIASRTTSIAHLGVSRFASLLITLPPIAEQLSIAKTLSTWDQGIRNLSDLIAAKIRFKQGILRRLLSGKLRPGKLSRIRFSSSLSEPILKNALSATAVEVERRLNGTSYDEGIPKLDACPQGWRTIKLEDMLKTAQRPVKLRPERTYQLVTAKRYRAGIVPREELRGEQIKTPTQFETKAGDFLISRRQIVHGACGLVPPSLDGAIVSNEYSCLQMSGELDPVFFEYLTHTKYIQRTFYQSSVGVTVEKMIFRLEKWLEYQIHVPPLAEQQLIVAVLSRLDQEIVLLDCQQKALTKQKQGLMQKILTGEVRVPLSQRKSRSKTGTT